MRFVALLPILACLTAAASAQTSVPPVPAQPAPTQAAPAPESPEVAEAEDLIRKSDWKNAETKLAAWLEAHPGDARALFDSGYVADAQDKLDGAAGFYRRAVAADPASFESHLSLGLLLARQGKPSEARPELATATQLDPGDAGPALKARAWRALAQIDRSTDAAQASADLLEALKLSPETPRDTLMAAELAAASGQPEAAETAYRRVLAKDPKNEEASAGLGHVLMVEKKYPEAETLLRGALQHSPGDPGLTAQLAGVLVAENKGEALPLLQKLHDDHPSDENVTRLLAEVLVEAGDVAGADRYYVQLLAAHPDNADLLVAHGQNLTRLQHFAEALQAFKKATDTAPSDGDAWSGLAFAASKTNQPAVALHALTVRSKFLPENPSTYFLYATSYDTLHDREAAKKYYHKFLEAAAGKYPDQEWQARQRLSLLEKKP